MGGSTAAGADADVLLAAGGDREAFARLVTATRTLVASIALSELRDVEAARDVAQDVYLQVWDDLGALRNPRSFLPFLRQVTRQRARRVAERRARELRGPEAEAHLAGVADPAEDAGSGLVRAERTELVRAALEALPDDARETVALYYLEGHSAAQVARLLGLRENAVHQRLSRARAELRAEVLARLGDALATVGPGAAFTAAVLAALPSRAAALGAGGGGGAGRAAAASGLGGKSALGGAVIALVAALALLAGSSGGGGRGPGGGGAGTVSIARPREPITQRDEPARAGPQTAPIEGGLEVRVVAAGGAAIPGAEVRVYRRLPPDPATGRPAWRLAGTTAAGADGRARLAAAPGAWLVTARAGGLAPGQVEVVHPSGVAFTAVEVPLAPGETLAGRVVARGSREPVPLAALWLERESELREGAAELPVEERSGAVADGRGAFSVAGLAPGRYRLVAEAVGHARTTLRRVAVPRSSPLEVELGRAGVIEGVVLLPDGRPAAGAEVSFVGGEELLTVTAGPLGTFAAEVEPGSFGVAARCEGFTGAFSRPVPVAAGATTWVELRLGAAASLAGRVTDEAGAPIAGAQVTLSPAGEAGEVAAAVTAPAGGFAIGPLAPGAYDLDVRADGHSSALRSGLVVLPGQRFELTIQLSGVGAVEGTVRDEAGAPIAGARVSGGRMWGGGFGAVPAEAVTGPDGRYLLPGLEVGIAEVRAGRTGMVGAQARTTAVEAGRRATADFVLPAMGTIEGRVRFEAPHAGDDAVIVAAAPDQPILRRRDLSRVPVDAGGSFQVAAPAGAWSLTASSADAALASETERVMVSAGETARVELVLRPKERGELAVQVLEPGGAPASGAQVTLTGANVRVLTVADGEGRASLMQPPADATVGASRGGRVARPVPVPADGGRLTLQLQPGGSLQGQVRTGAGGAPPQGFALVVEEASAEPGLRLGIDDGARHFSGDRFVLTDVRTGPLRLVATTADGRTGEVMLTLAPGEAVERDILVQPAAAVRVRPVGPDGRLLAGAYVRLGGRVVDTAADGLHFDGGAVRGDALVVEGLPPGRQELRIGARGYREEVRRVELAPGAQLDLGAISLEPLQGAR